MTSGDGDAVGPDGSGGADGPDVSDGPMWRDEFPFTSVGEEVVARRDFTRYLLAASGAFAVGAAGAAVWAGFQSTNVGEPRPIVDLGDVPEGTEYLFNYPTPDAPALLVNLPGGELRAFSQKCTHLGCVVFWQAEENRLFCPCHEGKFDPLSGDVLGGPPERPLGRIDIEVREGVVWALGAHEGGASGEGGS